MARYDFGGTLADFVVTSRRLGGLDVLGLASATLTFWSAQSGGTRYTDLVLNGSAVTSISVAADGQVPKFQGPDGVTEMWADGGAPRVRVVTLQGAPGPAGKDGTNGLPGVNAVANDTATASYITTAGSATQIAADGRYSPTTSVATVATASATLTANRHTPVDATSAARTMTLPTAAAGTLVSVEKVDASSNAVNVTGTIRGTASSTIALTAQYDARTFLSEGGGSWRPIADHRTQTSLDARYAARWQPSTAYTAGQSVLSPTGDVVTAKTSFTSGTTYDPTKWNLSLSYFTKSTVANTLPTTGLFFAAHRGGGGSAPEETLEAYRIAAAGGADILDGDVWPLGDSALAMMHDATVDRTTDGTGSLAGFTAPAFKSLNAAAKFPWPRVIPPALVQEFLSEFGGSFVLQLEPKDAVNAAQVMDLADRLGLKGALILATSSLTTLQAIKARGHYCYYFWFASPTTQQISDAVAAGADMLGCDGSLASAATDVAALAATGKPVQVFTINRRVDRDRLASLGARGLLGDHPAYLRVDTAQRTVDSWRQGVLGNGLNVNVNGVADMSKVSVSGGAIVLAQQTAGNAIPGELCPLANAAGTYHIDIDLGFTTLPASGGSVIVSFGLPNDANRHLAVAAGFPNGYLLLVRAIGGMSLYRLTDGSATAVQLGSTVATAALTAGTMAHLRIDVTPTTVTVARTDGTPLTIGPISDTTYRGGYFSFGKKDANDGIVKAQNLTIT